MTPTEFLTARYDEEAGTSVLLSDGSVWHDMPIWRDLEVGGTGREVGAEERAETERMQELWTARILADVAAKRAILKEHKRDVDPLNISADTCVVCRDQRTWDYDLHGPEYQRYPCRTVRAMLQPYAEHPDFDPAWRAEKP
jgi:hypothetical protein